MTFQYKILLFLILFPLGFIVGIYYSNNERIFQANTPIENTFSGSEIFFTPKVLKVEKVIMNEFYQFSEKSKEEIENGVITSLVESLGDKHSTYFPPKEAKEFADVLRGDFEGIGAVIDEHISGIIVRKVFDDSPAKKGGIQDGDIVISVGNENMIGLSAEEAVKKIRGPKGSKVLIKYIRGEDKIETTVEITRDTIIIPSTQGKMLTGSFVDIGYLEVAFFGERTPEEFLTSINSLTASGAKGIILDFRNNGGGYLDSAVDILSLVLPNDTLAVTTKENDPKKTAMLYTRANKYTNTEIPMVMLINGLSASATEIVAGALQDYKRAIIIGEKSYGKGSVQEPFILDDGSILKITIGRWYTPKDQVIDKNGITPDIVIPLFDRDFENRYDRQLENSKIIIDKMLSTNNSQEIIIEEMKAKDFTE